MIKLEIEIKEEKEISLDSGIATSTEIHIEETRINASKGERKVSEILKERLKVNEKIQFENLSKRKNSEEIINELFNKLLK